MEKYDVVSVGECLVDFVNKSSVKDAKIEMEGNPGGAPANVMAGLAALGVKTAFISKLGNDAFGKFMRRSIADAGICTDGIVMSDKYLTTLAMVSLDETGNRSFSFYRDGTADVMLEKEEVNTALLDGCRLFHFGSVSMTCEPARGATLYAAQYAKEHGALISYDANLREPLWESLYEAKAVISQTLAVADIVKLSEEELVFLTDCKDLETGMRQLQEKYGFRYFTVTLGADGAAALYKGKFYQKHAYDVPCVDTTGAGDAFFASTIYMLLAKEAELDNLSDEYVEKILDVANAGGSLATRMHGAIPAMPGLAQIEECMNSVPRYIRK